MAVMILGEIRAEQQLLLQVYSNDSFLLLCCFAFVFYWRVVGVVVAVCHCCCLPLPWVMLCWSVRCCGVWLSLFWLILERKERGRRNCYEMTGLLGRLRLGTTMRWSDCYFWAYCLCIAMIIDEGRMNEGPRELLFVRIDFRRLCVDGSRVPY